MGMSNHKKSVMTVIQIMGMDETAPERMNHTTIDMLLLSVQQVFELISEEMGILL
jgi:hypothetical protein